MVIKYINILDRGNNGVCLCCYGELKKKKTLTSRFLATRAFGKDIELSYIYKCKNCKFAFHSQGLSENENINYYRNYRDKKYFVDRNFYEFFYTRKHHDKLEKQLSGQIRRDSLKDYIDSFNILLNKNNNDLTILDYGGGTGRLIKNFFFKKYLYDISEEKPELGVIKIQKEKLKGKTFDFVVCAQTLEHVTNPVLFFEELLSYVKKNGYLYIEVPYNDTWIIDLSGPNIIKDSILFLAKRYGWFNEILDFYSTAFRVGLKIIPPFGFIPVKEHLNFFTLDSLVNLANKFKIKIIDVSRQRHLGSVLLIQK